MRQQERWKAIEGYGGRYQVSDLGRVRRLECRAKDGRRLSAKMLSPCLNSANFVCVSLECKSKTVHRLVAEAFCEKTGEDAVEVNHIDGDRSNNTATNLEWVTSSENTMHSYRVLKRGNFRPIKCVTKDGKFSAEFPSMRRARECGFNPEPQLQGRITRPHWLIWSYA